VLVDAPAQRVVAVTRGLDGGGWFWLRVRSGDLRFGPVVVARDRGFEHLVLGAVAKALHGVPADAALHDVAVQVVLEAQVLVDGEPVGGHLFAFVAGAAAAEVSTTVGVEQVACGVECEGFQVPARGGRSAGSIFLGGEDAAQGVVTVLTVAAQAVARGDEVACGVVLVQAGDALAGGQGSVPVPEGLG